MFLAALLCAGCNSPFKLSGTPPVKPAALAHVTLIITGLNDRSRTLFPDTPVFTSVRLEFEGTDAGGSPLSKAPMEILLTNPSVIPDVDFENAGNWIITAYGRILVGTEQKEVAEGSTTVNIVANEDITATITLTSIPPDTTENGTFGWQIKVPQTLLVVNAYSLTLSAFDNAANMPVNLSDEPIPGSYPVVGGNIVIEGTQPIPEGYYFLQASVGNADQRAYYVDVVHIHAHRTTRFEHTVASSEFVPILTLSGTATVNATINGASSPFVVNGIRVYSTADPATPIANTTVNGAGNWEMVISKRTVTTSMVFTVTGTLLTGAADEQEFETKYTLSPSVTTTDTNLSGIAVICALDTITLAGAVNPQGLSEVGTSDWEVRPYTNLADRANSYIGTLARTNNAGNWSMLIERFTGTIYFAIQKEVDLIRYERVGLHPTSISILQASLLDVGTINGWFIPPLQIKIAGDLPGLDVPKTLIPSSIDNKQFTYTVTDLAYNTSYAVNFSDYFTPTAITNNSATREYGFTGVVPRACSIATDNITFNGDSTQVTFTSRAYVDHYKTLKITLDFDNDDYVTYGKPRLTIETRHEVPINADTFNMGSPSTEKGRFGEDGLTGTSDEERHQVILNRNYYMMPTEVTQELYQELMPTPSYTGGTNFAGASKPVVNISWFDAVEFANKLSEREGLPPVYTITGTGAARSVTVNWNAAGWRLPTEAEWEYAARADSTEQFAIFSGYDGTTLRGTQANYDSSTSDAGVFDYNPYPGTSLGYITVADSYIANDWGLQNMHGNVWEYCWDWHDADYYTTGVTDPTGPGDATSDPEINNTNSKRVIRGGGYADPAWRLRSAKRGSLSPLAVNRNDVGFRLVRLQN